jgi:hypothetical protein
MDGMRWVVGGERIEPVRLSMNIVTERRGASAQERFALGADLPQDRTRAGVWVLDRYRIVVAEDPFGCERWMWCRFAVLDLEGEIVLSGTARETPWLVRIFDDSPESARAGLVWEERRGQWSSWTLGVGWSAICSDGKECVSW